MTRLQNTRKQPVPPGRTPRDAEDVRRHAQAAYGTIDSHVTLDDPNLLHRLQRAVTPTRRRSGVRVPRAQTRPTVAGASRLSRDDPVMPTRPVTGIDFLAEL
jgi:hypothetical protein